MLTYEDLLEVGEKEKGEFCAKAVQAFQLSSEYKEAVEAERYYNKHNATIEQYQKWLYTVSGRKIEDVFSANYKLKTLFFRRMVVQQTQYLLGNGVQLPEKVKDKLGADFDFKVQKALKMAMVGGRSFGFWNNDHLEVFGYACTDKHAGFCPIYSEDTAELMGGIRFRFKKVGSNTVARYTLYEVDGITEFSKTGSDDIKVIETKHAYKRLIRSTAAEGIIDVMEEGYNGRLPIVPLYANDVYETELNGIRENIDAYDLIKSGFANNVDDAQEIFWLIQNAGGMDDVDLAQFIQRLKTTHAATVDAEAGGNVTAQTIDIPTEARKQLLELLRADIYEDMMLVDMKTLSAAAKTTQEIRSAYQGQDNKCDDMEYFVLEFLQNILELAGFPNEQPVLIRSKVVNEMEQTNMVLSAANYVSAEAIIRHLPWLTSDEQEEEVKKYESEQVERFNAPDPEEQEEGDEE